MQLITYTRQHNDNIDYVLELKEFEDIDEADDYFLSQAITYDCVNFEVLKNKKVAVGPRFTLSLSVLNLTGSPSL